MAALAALGEKVDALRLETQSLKQCLEGFAGTMGLVGYMTDSRKRLEFLERTWERAKGAYSVMAFMWGSVAAVAAIAVDHYFIRK